MRVLEAARWLLVGAALVVARDAPARTVRGSNVVVETTLGAALPGARTASWAVALPPVPVTSAATRETASVRLYADDGEIDEQARAIFERLAAGKDAPRPLAPRVEQLLVRAAYHFGVAPVTIISAFRERAGRHGTGEAIDFKLHGVSARTLAAYLRGLPRAGVGVYTNPRTQFVHLDVRDQSYHWVDASPPGVKWREGRVSDPGGEKRDASWSREMDLPL